ncbi:MAG TPA: sigma-70 family RNA polymerase sigma factor [Acetobacteraceae bacterium]
MALLIEPLIPALRRYARAMTQDRSAADDLVQDCLERAISRWHQLRAGGDARAWIFTILHNLAINRLRQVQRRGRHVAIEDADDPALSRPATQEDALRQRDILQALATLSAEQRNVLLLVSIEDLSYAEAATVLGIPIGTVMSRLSRGREALRQAMGTEAGAIPARGPNLRRVK